MGERTSLCAALRWWREGRHWQAEVGRIAGWFGIASDRWMFGLTFNHEGRSFGVGVGPFYFGLSAAYDRSGQ